MKGNLQFLLFHIVTVMGYKIRTIDARMKKEKKEISDAHLRHLQ